MNRDACLALGWIFVALGTMFTFSPEFLSHSGGGGPLGLDGRLLSHHLLIHYPILLGGMALLLGLFSKDRVLEAVGLGVCALPVVLSLVALLTNGPLSDVSGLDVALRCVVIAVVAARLIEMRRDGR